MGHAILSPSGASRWLACTPSARLEATKPDTSGVAAQEGTLAHALGDLYLRQELGRVEWVDYQLELARIEADPLYNEAMAEHMVNYKDFVMNRYHVALQQTPDALIFVERKLTFYEYVQEGDGTGDAVIIADGVMDVIDNKYGKGVLVSAHENKQMMLYGLGAYDEFSIMYDIHTIRMTIFQPRLDNYSNYEMSAVDLLKWANDFLKPQAKKAFAGEGELVPGPHCTFCKVAGECRANAEYHLELLKHEFKDLYLLEKSEVSEVLKKIPSLAKWVKAVHDTALAEALKGEKYDDWKLVRGKSNRAYSDEGLVVAKLNEYGLTELEIFNKKIKGITDLETKLGKTKFASVLDGLIVKPPGKPTLALLADKREEFVPGADDFADVPDEDFED